MAGVTPPTPMLERSLLWVHSQSVAICCTSLMVSRMYKNVEVQPFVPDHPVVALDIGVLLGLAGLDVDQGDALLLGLGYAAPITVHVSAQTALMLWVRRTFFAYSGAS